jgi:hypothetical protein
LRPGEPAPPPGGVRRSRPVSPASRDELLIPEGLSLGGLSRALALAFDVEAEGAAYLVGEIAIACEGELGEPVEQRGGEAKAVLAVERCHPTKYIAQHKRRVICKAVLKDDDLQATTGASKRLLIDWIGLALIEARSPGQGRGPGRSRRQWSEGQRDLFELLWYLRREETWGVRELCDVVVAGLRYGDRAISTRQLRGVLSTWTCDDRRNTSMRVARVLARQLLAPLRDASPDFVAVVADALHHDRELDLAAAMATSGDWPKTLPLQTDVDRAMEALGEEASFIYGDLLEHGHDGKPLPENARQKAREAQPHATQTERATQRARKAQNELASSLIASDRRLRELGKRPLLQYPEEQFISKLFLLVLAARVRAVVSFSTIADAQLEELRLWPDHDFSSSLYAGLRSGQDEHVHGACLAALTNCGLAMGTVPTLLLPFIL